MSSSRAMTHSFPDSIEEAAALLGATITQLTGQPIILPRQLPPKGMHSAWSTYGNLPSSELIMRLYTLRSFLRGASVPVVSGRSILALLMKLISISSSLATPTTNANDAALFILTPPLLSTPIRKLWCDSVVLCHARGQSMETVAFVRQMLALAVLNPRSAKAAGGVRIAALQVISGLLQHKNDTLAQQLAPWSYEILQTTLRALKSAGHNEPTYRVAAMQMAWASATACRRAFVKTHKMMSETVNYSNRSSQSKLLVLKGAMEDKAVAEALKVMKQAVTDKLPEVRCEAAHLAARLAPMLILPRQGSREAATSPTWPLEEVLTQLAMRNLDDESPYVATQWAEAMARCLSTAVEFHAQQQAESSRRNDAEDADASPAKEARAAAERTKTQTAASRFVASRRLSVTETCSNLALTVSFLVEQFVQGGGEYSAARLGGTFSSGGRAVRVGWSLALVRFLRLQSTLGLIEPNLSIKKCVELILNMLGEDMEKEMSAPVATHQPASTSQFTVFGSTKGRSKGDPSFVRMATSRVLRQGLSEVGSESIQLVLLHTLVDILDNVSILTSNQIQILLIEISHLVSALGEAAASMTEVLISRANDCLAYPEHGVRHEAAIMCAAIAASFPSDGRRLVRSSLKDIEAHFAELVAKLSSSGTQAKDQSPSLGMFRRVRKVKENEPSSQIDPTLSQQYAIHGKSLMVSLLLRDLPQLSGGLPMCLVDDAIKVSELLVAIEFNDAAVDANPGALCMCVIAGFSIASGVLATGPTFAARHIPFLMGAWQKACESATTGTKLQPRHDLFCMDAVLLSIVAFLKFCPELLLTIPDALATVGVLLENALQILVPSGRLGMMAMSPTVAGRYERAVASLLESFAWLPSGSFPMAADDVFNLAARKIKEGIEADIPCSILDSMLNEEDSLLNAKTRCRAKFVGQLGGALGFEETLAILTSEGVGHGEREAVIHLLPNPKIPSFQSEPLRSDEESAILSAYKQRSQHLAPPTPLHDIGSWSCPVDPSMSSKVRLVDAAIQAFAATFGLKSGQEQQEIVEVLESFVPYSLVQFAQTIGISTIIPVQEKNLKTRDECVATKNIVAVLLACLKGIPLQDYTKNSPVGLGPQWMNRAKALLLTIMPSVSNNVLRGAAESLALLATVGVTEDAHFLQSALLHTIDEVMQGCKADGRSRVIAAEPASAARSGSMLTLCSIQRTQDNVTKRRQTRARDRTGSADNVELRINQEESLPLLQMMTRVLPSATYYGLFRDYFSVRVHAIHAYATFLAYSGATDETTLDEVDLHLLRKAIELIEGNFASCWTAVSGELEKGQEAERLGMEASFVAALLRLMTLVTPHLHHFISENEGIAERFSALATIVLEDYASHPSVAVEAMAFFEVLSNNRRYLTPPIDKVPYSENALLSCIPYTSQPALRSEVFAEHEHLASNRSIRASLYVVSILSRSKISLSQVTDMESVSPLMALHEFVSSTQPFFGYPFLRSLAAQRHFEQNMAEAKALEIECAKALYSMVHLDCECKVDQDVFLRWMLWSREILLGGAHSDDDDTSHDDLSRAAIMAAACSRGKDDASAFLMVHGQPRWQVKTLAIRLATQALEGLAWRSLSDSQKLTNDSSFSPLIADEARRRRKQGRGGDANSKLVYHLEDMIAVACSASSAAVDQSELRVLQTSAVSFLAKLVEFFGPIRDPEQSDLSILEQFLTQIISACKHALGSPDEAESDSAGFLFAAGCSALEKLVETSMSSDTAPVLRLIRCITPTDTFYLLRQSGAPSSKSEWRTELSNEKMRWFVELNKMSCVSYLSSIAVDARKPKMAMLEDFIHNPQILIENCETLCTQGARLRLANKSSLAGYSRSEENQCHGDTVSLLSDNVWTGSDPIDQASKRLLMARWARFGSCAFNAFRLMPEDSCLEPWGQSVVTLLLAGISDLCESSTVAEASHHVRRSRLEAVNIGIDCLVGICSLLKTQPLICTDLAVGRELGHSLEQLWTSLIIPTITQGAEEIFSPELLTLVTKACDFLAEMVSTVPSVSTRNAIFRCCLKPLELMQLKELDMTKVQTGKVVSICLDSAATLIVEGKVQESFVKSLYKISLDILMKSSALKSTADIESSATSLLKVCMTHSAISDTEKSRTGVNVAQAEQWDLWAIVASIEAGAHANASLSILNEKLLGQEDIDLPLVLLKRVRETMQEVGCSPLIDQILSHLGAVLVSNLLRFGSSMKPHVDQGKKQAACADVIKILLFGFQRISVDRSADEAVEFLLIMFECFLSVIRYNGLPNHQAPSTNADATIGRMCAQAITSVARTSPGPFKAAVALLGEVDRQLMEVSVRAEMSGYAVADRAPTKKLNVKVFTN